MSPYKDRRSMSFSSDCEDAMEESSVLSTSSPPRSCRSTARKSYIPFGVNNNTPNSRRLFGEDEEEKSVNISNYRRPKIKALSNNQEYDELSLEGKPTPARKRSSADSGKTSLFYNHHGSNNPMDSSGSDESDIMMYASPRISPNSFMTMDGRFVQSKNPFSSPMMDDTPISRQQQNQIHSATGAPSLPVSFFASSDDKMSSLLPPRHNNRVPSHPSSLTGPLDTPASNIPNSQHSWYGFSGGYPDKRFSFTGSPIMEAAYEAAAMETGMASAGSLRKVRRLHLGDDVVSATTHDLSRRHNDRWQLSVNTATSDSQFSDAYLDEQGISPTDVLQFPSATPAKNSAPPPTPVKSRQNQNTYNSICRRNISTPSPPLLERRRPMPLRTPHMGQQLDESVDTESNQVDLNRDPKSRFYSDFDVIGELGEGSFGTVYKVLSRLDGCMYAIKAAQRRAKGSADRGRMLKEVYALAALSDQADTANFHIVRYHQAWMEDDRLFIQTELCIGTLSDEIDRGGLVAEKRKYKLLREMLLALDLIHRNNMVHLDIKPDNIFVKNDQYKLGDFGLVTILSASQDVEEGDSRYMSMELLSGDKSDLRKCDIFSLGATLYEICLGRNLPMNGQEWSDIREGKLSALHNTSDDMVNIISQMLDPSPSKRPTPLELLQHHQLLSDEQKALSAAKTKIVQANIQLAAQEQRFQMMGPVGIQRRGLTRANTWNGTALPYM